VRGRFAGLLDGPKQFVLPSDVMLGRGVFASSRADSSICCDALPAGYYTIGEVCNFVLHNSGEYGKYMVAVGTNKLRTFVSRLDFEDLRQYLSGAKATSDKVSPAASSS
jgi:hypothetical protein